MRNVVIAAIAAAALLPMQSRAVPSADNLDSRNCVGQDNKMCTLTLPIAAAAVPPLSGCAGMSATERRTATGAGFGALGGYLYDQNKKSHGR